MAYKSSNQTDNEDMLSDNVSTSASADTAHAGGDDEGESTNSESSSGDGMALVPESFCPGMKPGDKFEVTVEEAQDGQYLISYPTDHNEKDESPQEEAGETPEEESAEDQGQSKPSEYGDMMG